MTTTHHPVRTRSFAPALHLCLAVCAYGLGVTGLVALIVTSFGLYSFQWSPNVASTVTGGLLLDAGLLALFGIQHTIMARPGFKQWWTGVVPAALERSIFVALSGALLLLILWGWQPMGATVWQLDASWARTALFVLQGAGWTYLLAATFAVDHFHLFGLTQPWRALNGRSPAEPVFRRRLMYRFDRHPIMTGVLVGLWATPHMRADTLALAGLFTLYIVVGVAIEERELVRAHGTTYLRYRDDVRSVVPSVHALARRVRADV
ncbi:NnrU protein [Planctomycetes bacterium Pla163]|uniref:NnrU protein n=1 Tax=Rohdeia mirabilis TaxID=2528008 RepID=A0A518D516_9BACT|nr:NnrU protein [Planctomycetes bacterium Pla163]